MSETTETSAETTATAPDAEKRVVIGEIVGPFGHKGEVKVYPHTDLPQRLVDLAEITLRTPQGEKPYPVRSARLHKNIVVMKLAGISTMSDAETLRGLLLVISPEERPELPEDLYYVDDLIGLRVITDDGRPLGSIKQVLKSPANDVYDLGNLLIPAIGDVVLDIDLQNGVMTIHPIPGLLDEPEVV